MTLPHAFDQRPEPMSAHDQRYPHSECRKQPTMHEWREMMHAKEKQK